jgi:hypothetical protein
MIFEYLSNIYAATDGEVKTLVGPILTNHWKFSDKAFFDFRRSFTPVSQETLWHVTVRTCPPSEDKEKRVMNSIFELLPEIKMMPNANLYIEKGHNNSDRYCSLMVTLPPDYFRKLIEKTGTADDLELYDVILKDEQRKLDEAQETWEATNALFVGALRKRVAIDHVAETKKDEQTRKGALSILLYLPGAMSSDGHYNDILTQIKKRIADIIGLKKTGEEWDEASLSSCLDCSNIGRIDILDPKHAATFLGAVETQIGKMRAQQEPQLPLREELKSTQAETHAVSMAGIENPCL